MEALPVIQGWSHFGSWWEIKSSSRMVFGIKAVDKNNPDARESASCPSPGIPP